MFGNTSKNVKTSVIFMEMEMEMEIGKPVKILLWKVPLEQKFLANKPICEEFAVRNMLLYQRKDINISMY